MPCSSSAPIAIAVIAIAAPPAAKRPAENNAAVPTHATNKARKGGSITATGSASIGAGAFSGKFA